MASNSSFQSGDTTHRDEDQWKTREPYRVHEKVDNFPAKWEGSCHCGKVTYQLSRDKPLAAKYCHCTTCHRFYPQRVAEFRGDGIVKWKGIDNSSDMIDDDENVIVKFEEGMKEKDMDEKKRKHVEMTERGGGEEVKKVKEKDSETN